MFKIIPSISIADGQVVRAKKGDLSNLLKYNYNAIELAQLYEDHGLNTLHLVDIDGARKDTPVNYHILEAIAGHTSMKVDFSGGIRTDGDVNKVIEYGATYFTVASLTVSKPELVSSWIISYGRETIGMAADCIDHKIHVKGWQKQTDIDLFDHIQKYYESGMKYVKITDITRDGIMEGPNFKLIEEVVNKFPDARISPMGGIRDIDDVKKLKDIGVYAVMIGRALYEDKIKLQDLVALM